MKTPPPQEVVTLAIVGDVHDQWEPADAEALVALGVDLVLFVGDFGNEAVAVVRAIAALDLPKAAVFGNHDAWYTATSWGRQKCPYDRTQEDWVQDQIEAFGAAHVGYGKLDVDPLALTVVGGRPFSWGGSDWKYDDFYQQRFGVDSLSASTDRICAAVTAANHNTILFLSHNGPYGLGDAPESPCGRDWKPLGGDFGDPDLTAAIAHAKAIGKTVSLVAFGHMHHHLRHTRKQLRQCVAVDADGTLYLNAARVPRILDVEGDRQRNFSLVRLERNTLVEASLVWVGSNHQLARQEILYQKQCQPVQ